jgi:hypothetical protein
MVAEAAFPAGDALPKADREKAAEVTRETTPGKAQEVRWEVVAVVNGLAQASILQGRLETEGVLARIHQEPAGVALGLTVGALGEAKVLVPEPLVEEALRILNHPPQELEDDPAD